MNTFAQQVHLLLPVGTRVVTRAPVTCFAISGGGDKPAGSVGVVVRAPEDATHAYLVRFADGCEAGLHRLELSILKQSYGEELEAAAAGHAAVPADLEALRPCVILVCVVGSRAFGLDDAESDTDRRGIFLPPAELDWSLFGAPGQLEDLAGQECYWELRKFLLMALKANPNVLECLYTPLIEHAEPIARELLAMRGAFLSRLLYKTFNGYVLSQFKKLEGDLRTRGQIKWKHAMHLLRLLGAGCVALETGELPVRVADDDRAELLAIKRGERTWEEINARRLELHARFEAAFATTTLPERPDYAAANDFLVRARRSRL